MAQLRQKVLVGDYARVLFKLSEVLKDQDDDQMEADLKRSEARALLLSMSPESDITLENEELYDKLVYTLWR